MTFTLSSAFRLSNCTFVGNKAGGGGAVWMDTCCGACFGKACESLCSQPNDPALRPVLENCKFFGNTAGGGGGMTIQDCNPNIVGCEFDGNRATFGGGVFNSGGHPTIANSVFKNNVADGAGGAISSVFFESSPTIVNSVFLRNSAGVGGAVDLFENLGARIINSTFSDNGAITAGGGAEINDFGPDACCFEGEFGSCISLPAEECVEAGGVPQGPEAATEICNSIFFNNHAGGEGTVESSQIGVFFGAPVVRHNLIQGLDTFAGEGNMGDDPLLTVDGHIRPNSPAIDAGDPSILVDPLFALDLDGEAHVVNGKVSIGADRFVDTDGDRLPDYWERRFAGSAMARAAGAGGDLNPDDDLDGDGRTNFEEYDEYQSNPVAMPYHVDGVNGDDAFDGRALTPQGSGVGPKRTIQAALDLAIDGDTILIAPHVYEGPGNRDLNFANKSVVLRGTGGSSQTIVDLGGVARFTRFGTGSLEEGTLLGEVGDSPVIEGLTITGGLGSLGGALFLQSATVMLKNIVLDGNEAIDSAGAIFIDASHVIADGLTVTESVSPVVDSVVFQRSTVTLRGFFSIDRTVSSRASCIEGKGAILLGADALLDVVEDEFTPDGKVASAIVNSNICGPGRVFIPDRAQLVIGGGATADLSGVGPECVAAGAVARGTGQSGKFEVNGRLVVRDATIRTTDVDMKLVRLEGNARIIGNAVDLVESTRGFGGEFTVSGNLEFVDNDVISFADRYLGIDPDPTAEIRPMVEGNTFTVRVTPDIVAEGAVAGGVAPPPRGKYLELRARDFDCSGDCPSGAFGVASASAGFSDTWVLEGLELDAGAILNLTNRPGFDFRPVATLNRADGGQEPREAIYVKQLVLGDGAVLNTAGYRLYYQSKSLGVDARIIDEPVQGFSLTPIRMDDALEFELRIQKRISDPRDFDRDTGLPQGTIGIASGVLDMQTSATRSIAAKAAFSRVAENDILVTFRYRFVTNPDAELVVYLSDDSRVGRNIVEIARLTPPAAGRPGSIGSAGFAVHAQRVPRGTMNLTRNTYLEFELREKDSHIQIDDLNPQVECAYEGVDVSGDNLLSDDDYLEVLSRFGSKLEPDGERRWCLDHKVAADHYLDVNDLFAWDTLLDAAAVIAAENAALARTAPLEELDISAARLGALHGDRERTTGASASQAGGGSADFQLDDGTAEDSIGLNDQDAGVGFPFGWVNQFRNDSGEPLRLTSIDVAFGAPGGATGVSPGDAVDAVIWLDELATGNLLNATKELQWSLPGGVHADDATFLTHKIPGGGVIVPVGADFYVGLGNIQSGIDQEVRFPASIDLTTSERKSWVFFGPSVFDPDDLGSQTVGFIENSGFPGNWLIRASGSVVTLPRRFLIGGKGPLLEGSLYRLDPVSVTVAGGTTVIAADLCLDAPTAPPSLPGPRGFRGNGRLTTDRRNRVYQLHGTQGLIRVDDGEVVVPSDTQAFGDKVVQIGAGPLSDSELDGEPIVAAVFSPVDDRVVYVVPVIVTAPAGHTYRAAAKLRLTSSSSGVASQRAYSIERLYGADPTLDANVNASRAEASEYDVQHLRDIAIDTRGNLFVAAGSVKNDNDWILAFDEATGAERRFLLNAMAPTLEGPTALSVSSTSDELFLASSVNDTNATSTKLFRFLLTRGGGGLVEDLQLDRVVDVQNMGHIVSIVENPEDRHLWVTGFRSAAASSKERLQSRRFFNPVTTVAVIPPGADTNTAADVDCHDLALGLSALFSDPVEAPSCLLSTPPALVSIVDGAGGDLVGLVGNRMIGLIAGDPGLTQRIKVTFTSLPSPFEVWNGTELWVMEPRDLCALSGVGPNDPCPDGVGFFKVADLTCDPEQAFLADWTTIGRFHVQHPGIVPSRADAPAVYSVAVVEESCDVGLAASFSEALVLTNSKYGDIAGQIDPGAGVWTAPDGTTDIAPDALASISAFSNSPINPSKLRADLEPCVLDGKINITDIVQILGGFSNLPYPFGPTTLDAGGNPTCPSPDPCGGLGSGAISAAPTSDDTATTDQSIVKPAIARLSALRRGEIAARIIMVPSIDHAAPGAPTTVDFYAEGVRDLRSYQVSFAVRDGESGSVTPDAVYVDRSRTDYVFAGGNALVASDQAGHRFAAALIGGGVDSGGRAHRSGRLYLGTVRLRSLDATSSAFSIRVVSGNGATQLTDSANRSLPFTATEERVILKKRLTRAPARDTSIRDDG